MADSENNRQSGRMVLKVKDWARVRNGWFFMIFYDTGTGGFVSTN